MGCVLTGRDAPFSSSPTVGFVFQAVHSRGTDKVAAPADRMPVGANSGLKEKNRPKKRVYGRSECRFREASFGDLVLDVVGAILSSFEGETGHTVRLEGGEGGFSRDCGAGGERGGFVWW